MSKPSLAGTLDFLRRLVNPPEVEAAGDRALVDAFVQRRDGTAFAALLRRHGPMVLAVCRRVLRDPHQAEDAFQATFLVLARNASSLRNRDSVGSWLHGIALRVAVRARSQSRPMRPLDIDATPAPPNTTEDHEVRVVIDEELDRLPDDFRIPLVLCYLEGLSVEEAARRLGWTTGTVRSRLWRGRKRLRSRLLRRGLAGAGVFVLWSLTADTMTAAVSAEVAGATATTALAFADGAHPVTAAVNLAEGVIRAMTWNKLRTWLVAVVAFLAFACAAALVVSWGAPADTPAEPPPPRAVAEDGQLLPGKFGPVRALAVSADGKLLAAGCTDKSIVFWDLPARKELFTVKDLPAPVNSVAFRPDGKSLAAGFGEHDRWDQPIGNGGVVLIDVAGRKPRDLVIKQTGEVRAVAFTPDGQTLAVGGTAGGVYLYDDAGKEQHHFGKVVGYIGALAFSPDGKKLAAVTFGGPIGDGARVAGDAVVWDVGTRKELYRTRADGVALAFTPDSKALAGLGSASLLDVETGKVRTEINTGIPQGLAFSPDGKRIMLAFGSGLLTMYDAGTGRAHDFTRKARGPVSAAVLTTDGKTFITAGSADGAGVVQLWDPSDDRHAYFYMPAGDNFGLAISPDGKSVATASGHNIIRYDLTTGKPLPALVGHTFLVRHVAFSPDGKTIATASEDWSVRLWDRETGKEKLKLWQSGATTGVAFSSDGKLVATASGGSQKPGDMFRGEGCLWDATTGKEVHRLKGHTNIVHDVAFLPDGKTVVTASFDQTVKLWDVATGKETASLAHGGGRVYCVAASPDGKRIASAGQDGKIRLWDVATRKEAGVLAGHTDGILQLAFSPDGKLLASTCHDHTARLWDLAAGKEKHVLKLGGWGYGIAFFPDGKLVATSGQDGLVRLWDAATGEERLRP